MSKFFYIFFFIPTILYAQMPEVSFTVPTNACSNELNEVNNLSINATTYNWDFCLGNFDNTPLIQGNLLSTTISNSSGLKIIYDGSNYFGFATGFTNSTLYRFDFGLSLNNSPQIVELGQFNGILSNPEGLDIIKVGDKWIGFVGYGVNGGHVTRLTWNSITEVPIADNIGSFGLVGRIRDLKIVKQSSNYILVFPYYNQPILVRVDYGSSLLNTPVEPNDIYISNAINDVALARGISVIRKNNEWKIILVSETNGAINYLDLGTDILSEPTVINTYFFNEIVRPLRIKVIREGAKFFAFVTNDRTNIETSLVDLKSLSSSDTPEIIGSYNPIYSGLEVIKVKSTSYLFAISNNLSRLIFENLCTSTPASSSLENPVFSFDQQGAYEIDLVGYDDDYINDYFTQSITVSSSLAPQPSYQITGNCLTSTISFAGEQLSGNITSWNWDFGDGSGTSTSQNDTYTYGSAGTYQVKLSVTDANGCTNLYIDTARVYEEPIPDFTAPLGTLCMNNPIAFTNTTIGETGPVVSWTWDFNGEGTSTEKEPDFTFLTSGSKTITLTSSLPGCANVTQQNIAIEEAPTTAFSFDDNTCNGQTTVFTDATTGNNLITWSWDFGDGSNSTDQSPTHNYTLPGKYVVTLAVSNNLGCTTTKVDTVYNGAIPVISFINDLPCSTAPIQFTDQSSVQDANLIAWEWDFGNGTTSTDQNPQYTYNQTGDFLVQLKAFSHLGCVDSTEAVISIQQGPVVDFTWDKGCEGEATIFTDSTNSFGQPITNWTWLIDDNLFTEQNPQYIFQEEDSFTVQLGVSIDNLCSQTISKNIFVETPPVTSFTYFESCTEDITTFVDTTPAAIESWEWRIDGTPAGSESIMTINLVPGNYSISLTTTSANRCITNITESIDIVGSLSAQYSVSTNYGAAPLTIEFSNQSTGTGRNGYLWLFGDSSNSSSTDFDPVFVFTELGCYPVTLIALGGLNCSDTTIQVMEVVEPLNELSIDAISSLDNGKIAISMDNSGSITYDENNLQLIFNIDDGADIIEAFTMILYPKTTINYVPSITLGETGNSKVLCVELRFIEGNSEVLDSNCINLNAEPVFSSAYPNPSGDEINLSVVLPQAGEVNIMMIDRNGAILLSTVKDGEQGLNNYRIDTTPYRSGLYIIKIEVGSEFREMKVVIDH